jgi:hypothetical protein
MGAARCGEPSNSLLIALAAPAVRAQSDLLHAASVDLINGLGEPSRTGPWVDPIKRRVRRRLQMSEFYATRMVTTWAFQSECVVPLALNGFEMKQRPESESSLLAILRGLRPKKGHARGRIPVGNERLNEIRLEIAGYMARASRISGEYRRQLAIAAFDEVNIEVLDRDAKILFSRVWIAVPATDEPKGMSRRGWRRRAGCSAASRLIHRDRRTNRWRLLIKGSIAEFSPGCCR